MERFFFRSDIWCSIRLDFSNKCLILGPPVFDFVLEEGLGGERKNSNFWIFYVGFKVIFPYVIFHRNFQKPFFSTFCLGRVMNLSVFRVAPVLYQITITFRILVHPIFFIVNFVSYLFNLLYQPLLS